MPVNAWVLTTLRLDYIVCVIVLQEQHFDFVGFFSFFVPSTPISAYS